MSAALIKKYQVGSVTQLASVAQDILQQTGNWRVFAFKGEMGSGKTTLIKQLCVALGSHDSFSSPTYSIVNEYAGPQGKIYHMDLYRLNQLDEALAIGIEDYISSDNYCFIEWPGLIEALLPPDTVNVYIDQEDNMRNISIFIG